MKKVCPLPPVSLVSDTHIRMTSVSCAVLRLVESQELAGGQDGCHFSCHVVGSQGLKAVCRFSPAILGQCPWVSP